MKLILSPTKTMGAVFKGIGASKNLALDHPKFEAEAQTLVQAMAPLDQATLKKLFKTSDALTQKTYDMIREFGTAKETPAMFAFRGDAFKTLDPDSFTHEHVMFAQEHLRIFSGLYGVVCPLDRIKPYRLDFNTPLKIDNKGLKPFWKKKLISYFETFLKPDETLLNLASGEYADVLSSHALKKRMITLQFKEESKGKLKTIPIRSKQARGLFARYIIMNQVKNPLELKNTKIEGYTYKDSLSSNREWFFIR